MANGELFRAHAFEYTSASNDIEHRTTKAKHPWTNGQVERMNRTIKDATVKRFHYDSHDQFRRQTFLPYVVAQPLTADMGCVAAYQLGTGCGQSASG